MSDKIYTLPSGIFFQTYGAPNESVEVVKKGEKKGPVISVSGSTTAIDSTCDRMILNIGAQKRVPVWIYHYGHRRVLAWPGGTVELDAQDLADGTALEGDRSIKPLKLTMPGKVLSVKVKEGETVRAGQGLVVVEAMKMENLLLAEASAKIVKVHVQEGDRLESGATLITFEAPDR